MDFAIELWKIIPTPSARRRDDDDGDIATVQKEFVNDL